MAVAESLPLPTLSQHLKRYALEELGFRWVECAPLVRSSYHAEEQVRALSVIHRQLYGGE